MVGDEDYGSHGDMSWDLLVVDLVCMDGQIVGWSMGIGLLGRREYSDTKAAQGVCVHKLRASSRRILYFKKICK